MNKLLIDNQIDIRLLFVNIILGIFIIYSYYRYLGGKIKKKISADKLWANIKGYKRNIYYLFMIISTISYLYLIFYLVFINKNNRFYIILSTLIFLVGTSLWAPLLYYHFIYNLNKIYVYLSLCISSVGIILLFIYIMSKGNLLSKIFISLFLFNVLILENIIWSINFQNI